MYCAPCFERLILDGFVDPTDDLALLYYVWHGTHLPGISPETARRMNDCWANHRLDFDGSGQRQFLYRVAGEWREVPLQKDLVGLI